MLIYHLLHSSIILNALSHSILMPNCFVNYLTTSPSMNSSLLIHPQVINSSSLMLSSICHSMTAYLILSPISVISNSISIFSIMITYLLTAYFDSEYSLMLILILLIDHLISASNS